MHLLTNFIINLSLTSPYLAPIRRPILTFTIGVISILNLEFQLHFINYLEIGEVDPRDQS